MSDRLRIQVDFTYGGRVGDRGIVYLHRRHDLNALLPDVERQLAQRGVAAVQGLSLVLWDADVDDAGNPAELEVEALLRYDVERGWYADYPWDSARWVGHRG